MTRVCGGLTAALLTAAVPAAAAPDGDPAGVPTQPPSAIAARMTTMGETRFLHDRSP
ncbi:hypothetical protein ACFS07_27320 [Undibacterium arcticum]